MDNSFFEYRDQTESDSDSEIIDNSFVFQTVTKTPSKKNQTVFVPESEDSSEDGSEKEDAPTNVSKSVARRSSITQHHVVLSSDDDRSHKGSIRKQSDSSDNVDITSSEDDADQVSPEMIPKRRPPAKPSPRSSDSFIGRKKKKHMILLDSESDNSFVKEHCRKKKCLKDTPLKIESVRKSTIVDIKNMSIQSNDSEESDNNNDNQSDQSEHNSHSDHDDQTDRDDHSDHDDHIDQAEQNNQSDHDLEQINGINHRTNTEDVQTDHSDSSESSLSKHNDVVGHIDNESSNGKKISINTTDEGLEEEQMVMSRATRMSIMGVIPKENDSDDSDYIQSDDTTPSSRASSLDNLYNGPDLVTHVNTTPQRNTETNKEDSSRISCSPIVSNPLNDITNEYNNSFDKNGSNVSNSPNRCDLKNIILKKLNDETKTNKENVIDDDVTIIDKEPEIIALSSDDEDEVKEVKTSPKPKEESKPNHVSEDIKQYLPPPSYPNQIVYVKKHVRENELNKLNGLKEDLQNVRYLMENMDVETLPDGGTKLMERLMALEGEVRRQGDKVANMVVDSGLPIPEEVAKEDIKPKDKDKGLTWDDIQKASNAVQPRMFGKQAMSTHMAERSLMLERLRDLYQALESRPPEHEHGAQPRGVRSALMPHQLHALAWLRWRETQSPKGGILADDMGLGKTITMIALIVNDKESSIDDDDDVEAHPKLERGGTLVVSPATLVQQWAGEVRKHCAPHALAVSTHHGAARATQPQRLAASDLVLTTYNILQRESEKNGVLTRVRWRRVILDEAHVVRNHKSATSQAVCALRAARRWALTGTPLHNKDLDLFALLKFLRCTPFDDLAMWKKWIDNKSLGGSQRLNTIMSCVMLRRTKAQLQEKGQLTCLPARTAHDFHVTLQQEEMNVYQKVLVFSKTLFAQFLHQRAEKQSGLEAAQSLVAPKKGKDNEYAKMHKKMIALQGAKPVKSHEILVLLLRLRQVCCHCGLIAAMLDHNSSAELEEDAGSQDLLAELNKLSLEDSKAKLNSSGDKENEEDEPAEEGTSVAEAIKTVLSSNNPVFSLQRQSSKIRAVMDCLNKNVFKNKGEKAVVVSQWTSVLDLVQRELRAARVPCVVLRGDVPVPARAALVDALNDPRSDVRVMLLSLCAGGVGLNLCGANHLLLLDPHWNPQLEEQAQDRIYRVGQTKPVNIYKFMCVDTVEQSIRKLQQDKLQLAENVLTGARNTNGSKLSIEDLKLLFNMGTQDAH